MPASLQPLDRLVNNPEKLDFLISRLSHNEPRHRGSVGPT